MKPTFNNVIISPEKGNEETSSGIYVKDEKKNNQVGEISYSASSIFEVGQRVIFNHYKSIPFEFDGNDYCAVSEDHILAVID